MVLGLFVGYILFLIFLISLFFSAVNLATALFSVKNDKKYPEFLPNVSVIVRTWNDESVIERCILNLLDQDYPKHKLDIIIVDDGKGEKTKEVCDKYKDSIKYIKTEHKNLKAEVIDPVIEGARGEIIVEKDVDGIAAKNWIRELVSPLQEDKIAGATGPVFGGNWYHSKISCLRNCENIWQLSGAAAGRYNLTKEAILYGGNKAYKKSAWKEVRGHPRKTMVEDAEISMKFIERGYKIAFVKNAKMMQEEVGTIKQYLKERKRWTVGDFQVWKIYKNIIKKNRLNRFLLMSNFSMDAWMFFSWVFLFFQPLFLIPILMHIFSMYIIFTEFRAKKRFYIYVIFFTILNPLFQILAILAILKSRYFGKGVKWDKIYHYPVNLIWPINIKE